MQRRYTPGNERCTVQLAPPLMVLMILPSLFAAHPVIGSTNQTSSWRWASGALVLRHWNCVAGGGVTTASSGQPSSIHF